MNLPQYSGKDNLVMLTIMPVFALALNSFIFGSSYYTNWKLFILATLITAVAGGIDFIICGVVAVALKKRFPKESQLIKRLSMMICTFLIITGLFLFSLFRGYEATGFFGYKFNETGFVWSYISMGILNIFLTFLLEGISSYENWKANLKETEALEKAYRQSQLLGLKSQVNPHFLFNSLNSLSSLIQEDEETAEKFLDEMSKVYRYMLRNDDEQLVTLETELKFVHSYMYLLKARYGDGLQLQIDITEENKRKWIPPLTLQVLIENAFTQNTMTKADPLRIFISTERNEYVVIRNNVQPKTVTETADHESGLDNLVNKYLLLNQLPVEIDDTARERTIRLPLISKKEEVVL